MAQGVIYVQFEGDFPSCEEIAKNVQTRAGLPVEWEFADGQTLVLRPGEEISAVIDFVKEKKLARIEVGMPPAHFEWVVVACLEKFGGVPSRPVPRFAYKKLDETAWWERLQLGTRLGWK